MDVAAVNADGGGGSPARAGYRRSTGSPRGEARRQELLDRVSDDLAVGTTRPVVTEAARAEALRRVNRGRAAHWSLIWEWAKSFQIAILLFLFVRTFLVEAFKIPSGSMEHTLLVGDFLLVNKLVYGAEVPFTHARLPRLREPQRGDVIVFEWPEDPSKNFVKRLVGLPATRWRKMLT